MNIIFLNLLLSDDTFSIYLTGAGYISTYFVSLSLTDYYFFSEDLSLSNFLLYIHVTEMFYSCSAIFLASSFAFIASIYAFIFFSLFSISIIYFFLFPSSICFVFKTGSYILTTIISPLFYDFYFFGLLLFSFFYISS